MEHTNMQTGRSLRNLYFVRSLVQLAWAALFFASLGQPERTAVLLVAYPLWDVACTLYDLKRNGSRTTQIVNALAGLVTAAAIGLTATTRPAYSIAAFGAWALIAGAMQLATGLARRRQVGGQWAMILSGAQSCLAGAAFVIGGLGDKLHAKDLGGYAVFGAIYFGIAGALLARKLARG